MGFLKNYGIIIAIIAAVWLFNSSDDELEVTDNLDLKHILDVTAKTIERYQGGLEGKENLDPNDTLVGLADRLSADYSVAQPAIHTTQIGVSAQDDASLLAYEDPNFNKTLDEGEAALFKIEIDGDQQRIIASSRSGAVNDHHFSGTGLLAGYLIGSMLTRQRGAGVTSSQMAAKKPVTAQAAARSRAGSGSHSRGK
ncbi:MAG: hypothetical protein ACI89J_000718 [Hyphomicrobiaceae bacterium]|jgi:hypothetical protein